jgi:hypothetical protein
MLDLTVLEESVIELQQVPGGPEILRSVNLEVIRYLEKKLQSLGIKPLPRYILPIINRRRIEAKQCRKSSKFKNDLAFLDFLDKICSDPQDSITYKIRSSFLLLERHLYEEFDVRGETTQCGHCDKRKTKLRHIVLNKHHGIPICRVCFKTKAIELVTNGIPPILLPFGGLEASKMPIPFRNTNEFTDLEAFYLISRGT